MKLSQTGESVGARLCLEDLCSSAFRNVLTASFVCLTLTVTTLPDGLPGVEHRDHRRGSRNDRHYGRDKG